MKFIVRLFMTVAAIIVIVVSVIKVAQGCTWKEAVGIAEELWKEFTEPFTYCCGDNTPSGPDSA